MAKKVQQRVFHDTPYVRCTQCNACGQRKRAKIVCPCCQQKVYDKDEKFHCKICGGLMREISSAEHDWELHYGVAMQEDPELDKISCVKKPHLPEGAQKFIQYDKPPAPPEGVRAHVNRSKNDNRPFTPTKYCKCGAIIDQGQTVCEACMWVSKLNKRVIEADTLDVPRLGDL